MNFLCNYYSINIPGCGSVQRYGTHPKSRKCEHTASLQVYSHHFCITCEYRRPSTARREVFVQLMLTGEVPHVAVCGMLWNCLFPAQFPEFWDTDVHAEMDAVSETICGGGGGGQARGTDKAPAK
jgi:hypothetical protein